MRRCAWLLLVPLLAGCVRSVTSAGGGASGHGEADLRRLGDEFLAGYLEWRPQIGTSLGLHEYDGRVTDFSAASVAGEGERLRRVVRRLEDWDGRKLTSRGAFDLRFLRWAVRRELLAFDLLQSYTRNPMTYAGVLDVNVYIKRDFAPLEQRVRSLTAVLEQAPKVFAAARANLDESLPRAFVETAIEQANGAADFLAKDLPAALETLRDPELRARFEAANRRAMDELLGYVRYLRTEKLPKANDRHALGREAYVRLLQDGEMISWSPEQLLELGMRELERQQQAFVDAARVIDPGADPIAVFRRIQRDHPTAEGLLPETAGQLERIRQYVLDHRIVTLPSAVRVRVAETPQFARATGFASMDTPGPFERKATEAYYYITPVEKDWTPEQKEEWLTAFNYCTTDVVSIHEAYPGHYTQFLCLNASRATRLQKVFTSYAFVEGWAHYAEQMLLDEGFGPGPTAGTEEIRRVTAAKYRMAQADEALLRVCRLCVSVRMHCFGMSVDEATRFFMDHCHYEPKPARQEALRGTFDPEYLYYTVGKLEIARLREDYRRKVDGRFRLQGFHDELLRHGAPPLPLLREILLPD